MKKLIVFTLIAVLMFTFAACSGGQSKAKLADDTSVMAMSFTPPEGYTTVSRGTENLKDDASLSEKDMSYSYKDGTSIVYAYAPKQNLSDQLDGLDDMETKKVGDVTFYIQTYTSSAYAYAQYGEDVYGIAYRLGDGEDKMTLTLDDMMKDITFTDATETTMNEDIEDIGDLSYTIDSALFIKSIASTYSETPDGTFDSKSCTYSMGSEKDKVEYRISAAVFKNTTIEEKTKEYKDSDSYEMGEKEYGGVTFTSLKKTSEDAPYAYLVQRGDDVYILTNIGTSNGLWYTRSEGSITVFENLMNTVSFK